MNVKAYYMSKAHITILKYELNSNNKTMSSVCLARNYKHYEKIMHHNFIKNDGIILLPFLLKLFLLSVPFSSV